MKISEQADMQGPQATVVMRSASSQRAILRLVIRAPPGELTRIRRRTGTLWWAACRASSSP